MLEKEKLQIDDRKKKISLVTDKVNSWGNRVQGKLASSVLGEDYTLTGTKSKKSMIDLFKQITDIVCS
jgi:hypothetical protein